MAKAAHLPTFGDLARRYGVTRSAVQAWERRGMDRSWPLDQIDRWREMHTRGRVVMPPADRAAAVAAVHAPAPAMETPATAPEAPVKPTADQVILSGLGFQETRTLKLRKEIERLSIIIAREKAELVPVVEVKQSGTTLGSKWSAELDALVGDMPGQLAGLPEAAIQTKLRARIELLKASVTADLAAL